MLSAGIGDHGPEPQGRGALLFLWRRRHPGGGRCKKDRRFFGSQYLDPCHRAGRIDLGIQYRPKGKLRGRRLQIAARRRLGKRTRGTARNGARGTTGSPCEQYLANGQYLVP